MRTFSKFVFICNLCFVVSVIMNLVQRGKDAKAGAGFPLPFVEGTMAVLGLLSLLFSIIFLIVVLVLFASKKIKLIPRWLVIVNFIALLAEVYWFILDK